MGDKLVVLLVFLVVCWLSPVNCHNVKRSSRRTLALIDTLQRRQVNFAHQAGCLMPRDDRSRSDLPGHRPPCCRGTEIHLEYVRRLYKHREICHREHPNVRLFSNDYTTNSQRRFQMSLNIGKQYNLTRLWVSIRTNVSLPRESVQLLIAGRTFYPSSRNISECAIFILRRHSIREIRSRLQDDDEAKVLPMSIQLLSSAVPENYPHNITVSYIETINIVNLHMAENLFQSIGRCD